MTISPLYWKLIGGGIAVIALGVLIASWLARGREIDRLESWQSSIVIAATDTTVLPDKKGHRKLLAPEAVAPAIAGLKRSADSCASTLAGIDQAALKEKAVQAKLDEQLAAILDSQNQAAESTRARITDLLGRKSTGDKAKDCAIMEADSGAAWDGWRN